MTKIGFSTMLLAASLLAACETNTSTSASMADANSTDTRAMLAGKTLVNPDTTMNLLATGQLTGVEANGDEVAGTWTADDGQWCRTLTKPAAYAGSACRDVTFGGDQVTMIGPNGAITYTMQ